MKNNKAIQEKLKNASKLVVEKMSYDPKPWQTLFKKISDQKPEIFLQVPQIIYEYAEKKLQEATTKEKLPEQIRSYLLKLSNLYCYNRWKGNRINCWITSETIKLCNVENSTTKFYTQLFNCDPILYNFQNDLLTGKKYEINIKDSYIQWELNQAEIYLNQSSIIAAIQAAYEALGAKLEVHDIWPPKKMIPFDIYTVKKVSHLFNDKEIYRYYNLATKLDTTNPAKAHYYAKMFIEKIKNILPNITTIKQEQAKQTLYPT